MPKQKWIIAQAVCQHCHVSQEIRIPMPAWKRSPFLFDCRNCNEQTRSQGVDSVIEMGNSNPPEEHPIATEVGVQVASRRLQQKSIDKHYPGARFIDVTSKADDPWVRFSPFFPHGGIPVLFTAGRTAASVEGIWQALKVFESCDVDEATLNNDKMKNIKRTVRRFGKCHGHRDGLNGNRLLSYLDARKQIYLPSYRWVLENRLTDEVEELRSISESVLVVLLDYETNCDIENLSKPLSHAGLVAAYLRGEWPTE